MTSLLRRIAILVLLALAAPLGSSAAADDATDSPSLDEQLLKGLDEQLGNDGLARPGKSPPPVGTKRPADATKPAKSPRSAASSGAAARSGAAPTIKPAEKRESTDEELLKRLDAGDEPGLGPRKDAPAADLGTEANPLTRIGTKMRAAETLIEPDKLSPKTTRLQVEIVHDIDELIKKLRKQMQQQQQQASNSKPNSRPQSSERTQIEQPQRKPQPQGSEQESKQPARDSQQRLARHQPPKEIDLAAVTELMKKVWGDLPERDREQMRQSPVEQFLPKYGPEIEKYFRRLADEDATQP